MTKHFACFFFLARRNQYKCGEVVFVFKLNTYQIRQYISLPSIVVIIVIAAERSVITLVVNMSTCKYNWKGLNESAFPAHLYLSQYYIFRDHSVNFTVDLTQGVFIDRFHRIDPTKTISKHQHQSPPLLIKSRQNAQGPEEMCSSLKHQNPSKISENIGTLNVHELF